MAGRDTTSAELAELDNVEISIVKLAELVSGDAQEPTSEGNSESCLDAGSNPTPTSLEADLQHYKDLFSKLRFSYIEQVTKEKFIRAITSDPPLVYEHQDNEELEHVLAAEKAALKALKTEVAAIVDDLARHGREISQRFEQVQAQTKQLRGLPERIQELQCSIRALQEQQQQQFGENHDRQLHLPLDKTLELVQAKEKERVDLQRRLESLQSAVPRKSREAEMLHTELAQLEAKQASSSAAAKEAQRRKEAALGGVGDDLEDRGRWWRGVEQGLTSMLAVEN